MGEDSTPSKFDQIAGELKSRIKALYEEAGDENCIDLLNQLSGIIELHSMDAKRGTVPSFMATASQEIANEYLRIRWRAREDPGTAGDQGEENWAELLRRWIPPDYQVVTKGRILFRSGKTSPQIDVLVLSPAYPRSLLNKKHYLEGGVLGAFECKLTLKKEHIVDAVKTASFIARNSEQRAGTPYLEAYSRIVFGVLSHSHVWKRQSSNPKRNIESTIIEQSAVEAKHPRELIDVFCVSDLCSWKNHVDYYAPYLLSKEPKTEDRTKEQDFAVSTSFSRYEAHDSGDSQLFTPIGSLISYLSSRFAWEDARLRQFSMHLRKSLTHDGPGDIRAWKSSVFSDQVRESLMKRNAELKKVRYKFHSNYHWDEWERGPV